MDKEAYMVFHRIVYAAIRFANWAHRDQKRKHSDNWYIEHPLHTAFLLAEAGVTTQDEDSHTAIVGAILHDVMKNPRITLNLIEKMFGLKVRKVVTNLTPTRGMSKRESRSAILKCCMITKTVKVADILSKMLSKIHELTHSERDFSKDTLEAIEARIKMERWFLGEVVSPEYWKPIKDIRKTTLKALDELEEIVRAKKRSPRRKVVRQ